MTSIEKNVEQSNINLHKTVLTRSRSGEILVYLHFIIKNVNISKNAYEFKVFSYSSVYGWVHKRTISLRTHSIEKCEHFLSETVLFAWEFQVFSYSSVYGGVHKRAILLRPFFCEPTALRSLSIFLYIGFDV